MYRLFLQEAPENGHEWIKWGLEIALFFRWENGTQIAHALEFMSEKKHNRNGNELRFE